MVYWQAFPSLLPRAPLAFLSRLKVPFPSFLSLPSQTPATHARRVVNKTLNFRLTFLILLTINFPEIISQGDWELIGNMTILET